MDNEAHIELIERFFDNDLSPDELKDFDKLVQNDPDFAKLIADYKALNNLAGIPGDIDLSPPKKRKWWLLLFLIIPLGIGYYFLASRHINQGDNQTQDNQSIDTDNSLTNSPPIDTTDQDTLRDIDQSNPKDTPPPINVDTTKEKFNYIVIIDQSRSMLKPMALATIKSDSYREFYRQGEYLKVIEILPDSLPTPNNSDAIEQGLILTTSLLLSGQNKKALDYLESLNANVKASTFKKEIEWYLALAYSINKQPEKAAPILLSLKNSKYKTQATQLLNSFKIN